MSTFDPVVFDGGIFDSGSSGSTASAGVATGAGSAGTAASLTQVPSGSSSGSGTANDATVSTAIQTSAPAETATGTGTSFAPSQSLTVQAGSATATGSAGSTSSKVSASVETASGAGSAHDASVPPPVAGAAFQADAFQGNAFQVGLEAAWGVGSAKAATAGIAPTAGSIGNGAAYDTTISYLPFIVGNPIVAFGDGAVGVAVADVGPNAGHAAGTGIARQPSTRVQSTPATATGSGSSLQAYVSTGSPRAGHASGTGAALGPSRSVAPSFAVASGGGAAHNAAPVPTWIAEVAAGTGSGLNATVVVAGAYKYVYGTYPIYANGAAYNAQPTGTVLAGIGVATGSGVARDARPNAVPSAYGAGEAFDATVATSVTFANAGLASGVGDAFAAPRPVAFRDFPWEADTITDPTVVTITGDFSGFEAWPLTPRIPEFPDGDYYDSSGWVKLVLTVPMFLTFNTFGSIATDTEVSIYADGFTEFYDYLYNNDDNYTNPFWNYDWSSIPENLNTDSPIEFPAGTYWIMAFDWWGDGRDVQLTIVSTPHKSAHPLWEEGWYPTSLGGDGYAYDARANASSDSPTAGLAEKVGIARQPTIRVRPTPATATGTGAAYIADAGDPTHAAMAVAASGTGAAYVAAVPRASDAVAGDTPPLAGELLDPYTGITVVEIDPNDFTQTDPQGAAAPAQVISVQTSATTYGSSFSFTKPTAARYGDTLMVFVSYDTVGSSGVVVSAVSGGTTTDFSRLQRVITPNSDGALDAWVKVFWVDEPAAYYFTINANIYFVATLMVLRSATGQLSFGVFSGQASSAYVTNHTTPSLTAAVNNAFLLVVAGSTTTYAPAWTPPAGMTEHVDAGLYYSGLGVFSQAVTTAGSIGAKTAVSSASTSDLLMWIWLHAAVPLQTGYTGWLKLQVFGESYFSFDTFGSTVLDTKLAIYADPPPASITSGAALYYNDDTETEPYVSDPLQYYWSSIPSDQIATPTITLQAGTYWIAVWPYDGPDWDGIGTITLNVTRAGGPTLAAYAPPAGSPVRIIFEQLGDIAEDVVWAQTELETALSGEPSMGTIVVKDIGITRDVFVLGQRIVVDLGPGTRPIWAGYLMKATRRFWFSVDEPDTIQRQWRLTVVDINILFTRRIVYKQSDPAFVTGPKYVAQTYDDTVIANLVNNWLDLSADDLDVTSEVNRVAYVNYGETTYPFSGAETFGEAMKGIAQLPAAVWGINPSRELMYADVDDRNAPFHLSDEAGPGLVGYRECVIIFDGSRLVTEVFAWGAGKGDDEMVFSRRAASAGYLDAHGLWQESTISYSIWKQATINKVTSSIIIGSPASRRGRQADRVEVTAVTHEHGLVVGDRVLFISNIWDYEDVIPIRRMRMSFPTPTDVRYELKLSHEIDEWAFQDPQPPIPEGSIPTDMPAIVDVTIADPCVTATYMHIDNGTFSGTRQYGPFTTNGGFISNWAGWINDVMGVLSFPGVNDSSIQTLNRVSGFIPGGTTVYIDFVSHDAGAGFALNTHGIRGPNQNTYRGVRTGLYEIQTYGDYTPQNFIYYYFGDVYNPNLTGSGTYRYAPPTIGTGGDSTIITAGVTYVTIIANAYGSKANYTANAEWNRNVITGTFRFNFSHVGGGRMIAFNYGAARVEVRPDLANGELRLITGSGATATVKTDWLETQFYILAISVDLENNTTRAKLWRESTPGSVTELNQQANWERVGDGTYRPFMGVWIENPNSTPFIVGFGQIRSDAWADATTQEASFNEVTNAGGWGSPWVNRLTNTTVGENPGYSYSSTGGSGTVTRTALSANTGYIERPMGGGAVDMYFSVVGYPVSTFSTFSKMHFAVSPANNTRKLFQLGIGNSLSITITPGVSASTTMTIFNGQKVNLRVQAFSGGMRVKAWASGAEPTAWTLERYYPLSSLIQFNSPMTSLPPFVWGIETTLFNAGESVTIGPAAGAPALAYQTDQPDSLLILGDLYSILGTTGMTGPWALGNSSSTYGRYRSWPFTQPDDGRAYATAFGGNAWTTSQGNTPGYGGTITWGLFGDYGPGAETDLAQRVGNIDIYGPNIPAINGVQIPFEIIIRGEFGMSMGGYPVAGGTGTASVTAVMKTYNYGDSALPAPGYSDYFIGGGKAEQYFTSVLIGNAGVQQWHPFTFRSDTGDGGGGLYGEGGSGMHLSNGVWHFQWGIEILDIWGKLREAGPLAASGFLSLPNWGSIGTSFRNVTFELVIANMLFLGRIDPCPPISYLFDAESGGLIDSQGISISSVLYATEDPYLAGTLQVFLNGRALRTGIDFNETNPSLGTFTFTFAIQTGETILTRYTVDL